MIQYGETIKSNWRDKEGPIYGVKIIRESEIRDHNRKSKIREESPKKSQNVDLDSNEELNFDDIHSPTSQDRMNLITAKGVGLSRTWDLIPIISEDEFIEYGNEVFNIVKNGRNVDFANDTLKNIYSFENSWNNENLYLVSSRKRQRIGDEPLNEIHLLSVSKGAGVKIPNGYNPATEIVFHRGETEKYLLIYRESKAKHCNRFLGIKFEDVRY